MTRREAINESERQVYEILEKLAPNTNIYDILTNLESYGLTYVVSNNIDIMSNGNIYFYTINGVVVVIVEKKEDEFIVNNHFLQYSKKVGETKVLKCISLGVASIEDLKSEVEL